MRVDVSARSGSDGLGHDEDLDAIAGQRGPNMRGAHGPLAVFGLDRGLVGWQRGGIRCWRAVGIRLRAACAGLWVHARRGLSLSARFGLWALGPRFGGWSSGGTFAGGARRLAGVQLETLAHGGERLCEQRSSRGSLRS